MLIINYKVLFVLSISWGMLVTDFAPSCPQKRPPLETLRVGVFLDLSGRTSSFGQATLNGVKLAFTEVCREVAGDLTKPCS